MSGLKLLVRPVFLAAASTTFNDNQLSAHLKKMVPSLIRSASCHPYLRSRAPAADLGDVIEAYNATVRRVFIISRVLSCLVLSVGVAGDGVDSRQGERGGRQRREEGKGWL